MLNTDKELKQEIKKQQELIESNTLENIVSKDYDFGFTSKNQVYTHDIEAKNSQQTTTIGQVLTEAISDSYISKYSGYDAIHLADDYVNKYKDLGRDTALSPDKIEKIEQYSEEHTARSSKSRKSHIKKTHKLAQELEGQLGEYYGLNRDLIQMRGAKNVGQPFDEREFSQLSKQKLVKDLELLDKRAELEMNLIKASGNKDLEEKIELLHIEQVYLAKKISAVNSAKRDAGQAPNYMKAESYQAQIDKLTQELQKKTAKMIDLQKDTTKKTIIKAQEEITERRTNREVEQGIKERTKIFLSNYDNELQDTRTKLLENVDENERKWREQILTKEWIAKALSHNSKNLDSLEKKADKIKDKTQAMYIVCLEMLRREKIKLSFFDNKKLLRGGVPKPGIERSIKTQLHPVRKFPNGTYVSEQDRINDKWNRKWLDAILNNDDKARMECIRDNIRIVKDFGCDNEIKKMSDFYEKFDRVSLVMRINLGLDNLKNDSFNVDAKINDNKELYKKVATEELHLVKFSDGSIHTECDDVCDFTNILEFTLSMDTQVKFSDGTITIMSPPEELLDILKESRAEYKKAKAKQNNAE